MNIYSTNWQPHGPPSEQAVEQLSEHLDHRRKSLKDTDRNRRILCGFLAARGAPFDIYSTHLPKEDKQAVRDATECLTGAVLKRAGGKHTYRFDNSVLPYSTRVQTIVGDNRVKLETTWGALYTDSSFQGLPFEAFGRLGYGKPQLVEIIAPHHQWGIFLGERERPSVFWHELEEVEDKHPQHEDLITFAVDRAARRGIHVLRYGEAGFLCTHPTQFIKQLDANIGRYTNTAGQRPLLCVTDLYGRKIPRPGNSKRYD